MDKFQYAWIETRKEIRTNVQKNEAKKRNSDSASQFFSYKINTQEKPYQRIHTESSDFQSKINSLYQEPRSVKNYKLSPQRKADEFQLSKQRYVFQRQSSPPKTTSSIMSKIINLDLKIKSIPMQQLKQNFQKDDSFNYLKSPPLSFRESHERQKSNMVDSRVMEKFPLMDVIKLKNQLQALSSRDVGDLNTNQISMLVDLQSTIGKIVQSYGKKLL